MLGKQGSVRYFYGAVILSWIFISCSAEDVLVSSRDPMTSSAERKYLLYDVNAGEGFNLRRDVFMRVANTVRILRQRGHNYVLVLPPWGGLYHWRRSASKLPWSLFFDVSSINRFIPVIEFQQFLHDTNNDAIDEVVYLQAYAEGWNSSNYEIKFDKRDCIDGDKFYHRAEDGKWNAWFFSYPNVRARQFLCVSIQGDSNTLADLIERDHSEANSLFIDRAEAILHSSFGDSYYWEARRSMRYAKHLVEIGDKFRSEKLNSDDVSDKTVLDKSWDVTKKKHGDAIGGPFVCIHWRRRDFVRSHSAHVPSIEGTAELISGILRKQNLETVFLSTDAPSEEVNELRNLLGADIVLEQFLDNGTLSDGEVSIIDQWICAHARYFSGTHLSTFSYRIHEDREILGFNPESTFNCLCPDGKPDCEQPAKWRIVYSKEEFEKNLYDF